MRRPDRLCPILALGLALAGSAGAEEHRHNAAPGGCDEPTFACAREATPAIGADGSVWLAWTSAGRVWSARSADGASFAPAVEITRGSVRLDHAADARPQIVVDDEGRLTVGYAVMTGAPFQGELYVSHSADGRSFTVPRPLSANPAGKRFLALARDPGGDVFAAWVDKRGLAAAQAVGRDYAGAAVLAAWSRDGGATFGEPLTIREHTCECCRLAVDFAGAGRPVVVWRNLYGKARDHAVATFLSPGVVGAAHRVSNDDWQIDACPHHGPSVTVDAQGAYHVAWFTASPVRTGLFYARSTDAGATFTPPLAFGDPGRQPARPQLLTAGGSLYLAWREFDGEATDVVLMRSTDGGRSWSRRRVLARSAGTADHPQLVAKGGRAYVSWLTRAEGYRLLPL